MFGRNVQWQDAAAGLGLPMTVLGATSDLSGFMALS
jgi:hypothetical protein